MPYDSWIDRSKRGKGLAHQNMNVSIEIVSDTGMLRQIESQWDSLVGECSRNPFLLTCFVKPFISLESTKGWSPMIMTASDNAKLLGIIPLIVKRVHGLRFAKFMLRSALSPDFIINPENSSNYMQLVIDYVFNRLGCHLLSLDFSIDSQHLETLKQECKRSRIHSSVVSEMGHRVLPIRSTWQDFEKHKGGKFRHKFRKIEHNLDKIGKWKIVCAQRNETSTKVLRKILEIEEESWKEAWRGKKGSNVDDVLMAIWEGLNSATQIQPDLDWAVWFLEIDGRPIAYTLVVFYAGVAYITKTSYNARYRRLYPGIYINHAAIRQLWDTKNVRLVDFETDLQFMETWTDDVEGRVRIVISKNPILPFLLGPFLSSNHTKKTLGPIIRAVLDRLPGLAII